MSKYYIYYLSTVSIKKSRFCFGSTFIKGGILLKITCYKIILHRYLNVIIIFDFGLVTLWNINKPIKLILVENTQ